MTQYENYPEREYAVESKRNILETHIGRKYLGKLEVKYEVLLMEIDEELFEE